MFNEINRLFATKLKKILRLELHNEDRINLYCVGEYWAAFDKSAYMLERLVPDSDPPMVLNVKGYPFPLVMYNVYYRTIDEMCYRHTMARRNLEYIQFLTTPIDDTSYNLWYDQILADETGEDEEDDDLLS